MNVPDGTNGSWNVGTKIWNVGFLSGYNLCIFIGIIIAFLTVAYFWKRQKYSWEHLQILMILIIPCSIFGARLYTVIFDGGWDHFFTFAGMSIYGGVIGAIIPATIYLWFRRSSLDYRTVLTIFLPTVLIGQALGRWGNFQNHELYGHIVSGDSLDWMTGLKSHMYISSPGYTLASGQIISAATEYRAPMFFYESMLDLGGYILLVWVLNDRNWLKPGVTGALYMVVYGIIRLILQIFRDASPQNTSYIGDTGIALNLVVSGLAISFGVLLALYWQFRFQARTYWVKVSKKTEGKGLKFEFKTKKLQFKDKKIFIGSPKRYVRLTPKKEVRRCWVGKKYERTFIIWIPDDKYISKWSKRELNRGIRNKKRA